MSHLLKNLNTFFAELPQKLDQNRKKSWLLILLIIGGLSTGIFQLRIDMTMDAFLIEGDPQKEIFDRFKENFTGDENIVLVYEAKDGDVLSQASLEALSAFVTELDDKTMDEDTDEKINPFGRITRIQSLINTGYIETVDDTLYSRDFVGESIPVDEAERENLRQQAQNHPDFPKSLISTDSRYATINITTDFGKIPFEETENTSFETEQVDVGKSKYRPTEMEEYTDLIHAMDTILEQSKYSDHLRFHSIGNPVLMTYFMDEIVEPVGILYTVSIGLMFLILLFIFRSISSVIWVLLIVVFSTITALGFAGWTGMVMSSMITIIVLLLLVVGIAGAVHILTGFNHSRRQGNSYEISMYKTYEKSGLACFLTSLTTSIGLLSLIFVPIAPIRAFGITSAFGVLFAFLLTVLMLPLLMGMSHRNAWVPPEKPGNRNFLKLIEPRLHQSPKLVLVVFSALCLFFGYGISRVEIDSNMVEIIKEGEAIRVAYDMVDKYMGGSQNMEVLIDLRQTDGFKDPDVLKAMDRFQQTIEKEYPDLVKNTYSLVNVVKNTYKALNEGRDDQYIIPDKRDVLAQTLFMFDNADPEDREELVPNSYAVSHISVRLVNKGSKEYVRFFQQAEFRIEEIFEPLRAHYPNMTVEITGSVAIMIKMIDLISWSQIKSFGLALLIVTIVLLVVFGSIKVGLIAMVPNLFPVLVTFGTMGWLRIPLDTDTLIIAPIIIGISVDDTIHFLTHYRSEMIETESVSTAIRETILTVGRAVTYTSIIVALGMITMVFSKHTGIGAFGALTAVAMFSALIADLMLLPSLCKTIGVRFKREYAVAS